MVGDRMLDGSPAISDTSALASPKSSTLILPSGVARMLAGLRSRWTTPGLVGGLEAPGDPARRLERLLEAERAARQPLGQVLAGHQLHGDEAHRPWPISASCSPCTVATLGWFSEASNLASRSNRAQPLGVAGPGSAAGP